jgi:hypothetical protein
VRVWGNSQINFAADFEIDKRHVAFIQTLHGGEVA